MNKLKMKAKAGVTLVELLVVILIVTILSVSMLPLLQPFVTEAQYAAEAIPVIGNLRTKIGLYVYEKGQLPMATDVFTQDPHQTVETWMLSDTAGAVDVYIPAYYQFASQPSKRADPVAPTKLVKEEYGGHINNMINVDYQDLKGKRSKPLHYQYLAINTNTASYVVACFGNGDGLKAGTGYAVCELNFPLANRKLIGTWKRYKSYNDQGGAIVFTDVNSQVDAESGKILDCYIPKFDEIKGLATAADVETIVVEPMKLAGWEF